MNRGEERTAEEEEEIDKGGEALATGGEGRSFSLPVMSRMPTLSIEAEYPCSCSTQPMKKSCNACRIPRTIFDSKSCLSISESPHQDSLCYCS